jgi:hypothetical protein
MIVILTVIVVTTVATFGVGFIVVFGDVIVCIVLIALLMRFLFRRK